MPEGHTVHRIAADHHRFFAGQRMVVQSPQGRFAEEADQLNGKRLESVTAHGKHLFYQFTGRRKKDRLRIHIHLGLYGKFRLHKNPLPEPRGAVRLRMIGQDRSFDLNGPNQCKLISEADHQQLMSRLGQDPLSESANPEVAWIRISKSRAAIGTLLLNQSIIAGIGNIYRAEILHLCEVHPERKGNEIQRATFDKIWETTVRLMQTGLKYNRIITVDRASVDKPLSRLRRDERLLCYKKERCTQCNSSIRKWELGSRSIFACEGCQV